MNVEQNRLDTFHQWPDDAPVPAARIAKAGFFYTQRALTVECFACHTRLSEWAPGDQVMSRHKAASPRCAFVRSPAASGNVPIAPAAVSAAGPQTASMLDEASRLGSFADWPIPHVVSPESLARAGFYYLRTGDSTKCAFCEGVVRAWEVGDDPDREHCRHFEACPFVRREIMPRLSRSAGYANLSLVTPENLHLLGVQAHKGPKKPAFATLEARMRSFATWPTEIIQTPDVLAAAGFYYEGMGDQVRCFHCDGGLRHWDPQDDPWTEHARWFPRCSFVQLVKGCDFVAACAMEVGSSSNLEETDKKVGSRKREVTEREIQEHMTSATALAALSIGLNVERVKRAIREKLEQTGRGYSQPDALVEAALNLQHDEETDLDAGNELSGTSALRVKNVFEGFVAQSGDEAPKVEAAGGGGPQAGDEARDAGPVSLEEENRLLKEARLCKICMDAEVGIVFLPCGHLTTCVNCAPNLEHCPVCRSAIKATVRTFLS